jgi:hypothetical protein
MPNSNDSFHSCADSLYQDISVLCNRHKIAKTHPSSELTECELHMNLCSL